MQYESLFPSDSAICKVDAQNISDHTILLLNNFLTQALVAGAGVFSEPKGKENILVGL